MTLRSTSMGTAVVVSVLIFTAPAGAASPQQTPAAERAADVSAPPQPPLPNRLNQVLPPWIRLRAELRERFEDADNIAFATDRDDAFWLSRVRVNATLIASRALSFQIQVQDARVADKQIGATGAPFSAPFDLRVAFADVGAAAGPLTIRAGRQELAFGEQRLVGHVGWANAARSFDGVRATLRHRTAQLDVFAASLVRILPGEWDRSGNGNVFTGAYGSIAMHRQTIEPYVFWRRDRNLPSEGGSPGDLHQTTIGVRLVGALPAKFDWGTETVVQRGSLAADSVRAWATHAQLRTPSFGPAIRAVAEYNYASGDRDAKDGVRGTFDQLYPTPHDKYGLADQVGWRNIHHVRAGAEIARVPRWPITASYHTWWLADPHDGLYLANGSLLARVADGRAPRHVGQEIDLQVAHPLTPQLQLAGGYAYIVPGAFLDAATPGASYSTPFVMLTYVFLAEK